MYLEWVLVNNRLAFTICPTEDDITSTTPDPEPSQPQATYCMELTPEPTTDQEPEPEPEPAAIHEPDNRTKSNIAPEPEPHRKSDKVCEMATPCVPVVMLVEYEGME
ncbi:hypothetical protein DPX16_8971 [Anabarilius grahami]|uniref:Uncharacterized protein n=1 Tax=Anabarilius grahami TaxID=495550 RepID=A0A3N0XCP1_ANAGA|nr:hypothetical protein DPX16_8971 [Anabarilius grahami]